MQVVRLGPGDVEDLIDAIGEESRNSAGEVAFDVLIGVDEHGVKVRQVGRWTAPIGKVENS